ncbi:DUF3558 family protein [Saccharomonospora sp. NPDC046836]|uniref:DUF3558 family protein n=1 Tax=Saccharomonospora sp. NPDC046836 TaxID=3156921 RepID=UPI0033D04578
MRASAFGVLAACVLLSACSSTLGGTAQPQPAPPVQSSANRVAAGEPCALLSPEQASGLGLVAEGEFVPGERARLMPPSCQWAQSDPASELDSLTAGLETTFSLATYMDGAEPLETLEYGGRTWGHYPDPLTGGSVCMLAIELSETSFIVLTASDFSDPERACDVAKAAAPQVTANLSGT